MHMSRWCCMILNYACGSTNGPPGSAGSAGRQKQGRPPSSLAACHPAYIYVCQPRTAPLCALPRLSRGMIYSALGRHCSFLGHTGCALNTLPGQQAEEAGRSRAGAPAANPGAPCGLPHSDLARPLSPACRQPWPSGSGSRWHPPSCGPCRPSSAPRLGLRHIHPRRLKLECKSEARTCN